MQIEQIQLSDIVQQAAQRISIKTPVINKIAQLKNLSISFDRISIPNLGANSKPVILNKYGIIDQIILRQNGLEILNIQECQMRQKILAETYLEQKRNFNQGHFFMQRINHDTNLSNCASVCLQGIVLLGNNPASLFLQEVQRVSQISNCWFGVQNAINSYNNTIIDLYPYFYHTWVNNTLNNGYLNIKNLEIEILLAPPNTWITQSNTNAQGLTQNFTEAQLADFTNQVEFQGVKINIPHNQFLQLKTGTQNYDHANCTYTNQSNIFQVSTSSIDLTIKKIFAIKQNSRLAKQRLLFNFGIDFATSLSNPNINLLDFWHEVSTPTIRYREQLLRETSFTDAYFVQFLRNNMSLAIDEKKSIYNLLFNTNIIAADLQAHESKGQPCGQNKHTFSVQYKDQANAEIYIYMLTTRIFEQLGDSVLIKQ